MMLFWDRLKNIKTKHLLFGVAYVLVFVFIFFGTYLYLSYQKVHVKTPTTVNPVVAEDFALPPSPTNSHLTFILLGHGGEGHSGGSLMDSIILVDIDSKNKKAAMISIPRDLWIEGRKINEGYVAGGYDLLKHEVQTVTGIFPDNYVSIDFNNYKKLIDTLGGVDVNVTKAYEDRYYPIKGQEINTCGKSAEEFADLHRKYSGYQLEIQFECRYEDLKFSVGITHMDGELALKYVRSRHGDGDFGRSERQFIVLNAIKEKLLTSGSVSKIFSIVDSLTGLVTTNLSPEQIRSYMGFLNERDRYKIASIHLTDANVLTSSTSSGGAFILVPRSGFPAIKDYIKSQL